MNCEQARHWLLQSDDPRPQASASALAAGHLAGCDACRGFAAKLVELEQTWRDLPAPAGAEPARLAFLGRLPKPAKPQAAAGGRFLRWVTAALVLFAVAAVVWTLAPAPEAHAAPLLEQLVDWNLDLAQAPDQAERSRIYAEKEDSLKSASRKQKLSPAERELVSLLLETGSWLSTHNDPVDAAERFSAVADKLVERFQVAAHGKDAVAQDRYAKLQAMVNKRGVGIQLARAQDSGALNFENERRIEKVVLSDSKRMQTLVDLLDRDPDLSRKEIRQALELPAKAARTTAGLVFDLEVPPQPIVIGQTMSYVVRLHNQGPPLHKLLVLVSLRDDMEVIDAKGPTGHRQEGRQVIFRQLATLPRGGDAAFEINVKATRLGAMKCRAELRSKQLGEQPLWREQAVTVVNRAQ